MGSIKKAAIVPLAFIVLLIIYLVFRGFASWKQGYSQSEMDWDQNGSTSISEFIQASDVGKRSVEKNDQACAEYFAYKDGLPIKTICTQ